MSRTLMDEIYKLQGELAATNARVKELEKIAALCKEEIDHGFDLPSEVFDAVEAYYARQALANSGKGEAWAEP